MGSVKDLEIIHPPTPERAGTGRFRFSDRYSVFDWGGMPDLIPHKGEALTLMTAYFFEKLEAMGIGTHYLGVVDGDRAMRLDALPGPSAALEVSLVRVIRPGRTSGGGYDYSPFRGGPANCLVPLEVIYRNYLPEGCSFLKRWKAGSVRLEDYGLAAVPPPDRPLARPILDFSTKLEPTDRYLPPAEAQSIAGLTDAEFASCLELLGAVNGLISRECARLGVVNVDGKIELGLDPARRLLVVDALGTPDECRFFFDGFHVSKEVARAFYRRTAWYEAVEKAKVGNRDDWKAGVAEPPPPLPAELRDGISAMYRALANTFTGREWFPGTPPLSSVVAGLREMTA
jgi:phosphoribosylaminoimidazole-succinocarboxamide synthase